MPKDDEHLKELVTIRKLMILGLMRSGMTQAQVGAVLGMDRTSVGKMFPSGALAELRKKGGGKKVASVEEVNEA